MALDPAAGRVESAEKSHHPKELLIVLGKKSSAQGVFTVS